MVGGENQSQRANGWGCPPSRGLCWTGRRKWSASVDASTVRIAPDVKLGRDVRIYAFANLYGCEIGDESKIGAFVEIQKGVRIGCRVKVSSHSFICEGVTIEDEVFIGHGVMFTNDKYPRSTNSDGSLQTGEDWAVIPTL